jgi:hypothetical protein
MARVALAFGIGICVGLALDRSRALYIARSTPKKPKKAIVKAGRRGSLICTDAYNELESAGKIDWHLSPSDNAVNILESILLNNPEDLTRVSILYALEVLKSNSTQSTVPVGLQIENDIGRRGSTISRLASTSSATPSSVVVDWLLANYTPETIKPVDKEKKLTFKSVARSVKAALKFKGVFEHTSSGISELDAVAVDSEMRDEIRRALRGVDEWDWDIWNLDMASKGRPLHVLGWHLLHKWDLINTLKLDRTVVLNWLVFVEGLYKDNEYHTAIHAADVLQAVHHLLKKCGVAEHMSHLLVFALLITAMIHDAGHDGLNNLYHQNALTDRALLFNDQSVQENYHCMSIFTAMAKDPAINVLGALDPAKAKEVRRLIILMTLGTDMKSHFKHFQDFKSLVSAIGTSSDLWAEDPAAMDQLAANLLHAADLSNPCRPFPLARKWAGRVLGEFFAQGDRERAQGLPVSPLCSRDGTLVAASQIGFIDFVVLPYFQVQKFCRFAQARCTLTSRESPVAKKGMLR